MSSDKEFDIWAEKIQELFLVLVATVGMIKLRASYRMVNHHYAIALAARLSVEAAGLIIAEQINGQSGVNAWRRYSNDVFSVDSLGLIPDPLAVIDSIAESETMIRQHYGVDQAVQRFAVRGQSSNLRSGLGVAFSFGKKIVDRGMPKVRTFTL